MKKIKVILLILGGAVAGFINGLLGSGGGLIVVPLLTYIAKLNSKKAHATAILIILPITIISLIVYFVTKEVDIQKTLWVSLGAIAGAVCGSFFLKKISNVFLQIIFAVIMLVAGVRMFF